MAATMGNLRYLLGLCRTTRNASLLLKVAGSRIQTGALSQLSRLVHTTTSTQKPSKVKVKQVEPVMQCNQCEQTKSRNACTAIGVCGKSPQVAHLQDLLIHVVRGVSMYANRATKLGAKLDERIYDFTFCALFSTLTNVNFDPQRFRHYIIEALATRDEVKAIYEEKCRGKGLTPDIFTRGPATWSPPEGSCDVEVLDEEGKKLMLSTESVMYGDDVYGVRQMISYGLKGMATYARHASVLGQDCTDVAAFVHEAYDFLETGPEEERNDLGANLGWALKVGEQNLKVMERLDRGHRERFGIPEPTQVRTKPVPGKAILVSGHDMHDLEQILQATEGTGVNVYTHGEMLPAHSYPGLKKYKHLVGNYGGAWQIQQIEFPRFPGAIIVTTNCMIEPLRSYKNRIFTLNDVGYEGVQHIDLSQDMGKVIKSANQLAGYPEHDGKDEGAEEGQLTVGFGRDTLLANAETVIKAVKSGELKRIFLVGGCDGSEHKRNYFSTLVDCLPQETVVLTLGCAKYRFNRHELGTLGSTGFPRLMDMGQCNDAYGAVVVASALAEAFETDINSLPLSIALSWFEQKAVAVLLSLLHLGVQNIRLGPVLPAFVTPNVLQILVDKFNISSCDIRHPKDDLKIMMGE